MNPSKDVPCRRCSVIYPRGVTVSCLPYCWFQNRLWCIHVFFPRQSLFHLIKVINTDRVRDCMEFFLFFDLPVTTKRNLKRRRIKKKEEQLEDLIFLFSFVQRFHNYYLFFFKRSLHTVTPWLWLWLWLCSQLVRPSVRPSERSERSSDELIRFGNWSNIQGHSKVKSLK